MADLSFPSSAEQQEHDMPENTVNIEYMTVVRETAKAVLLEIEPQLEVWMPLSQIIEWDLVEHEVEIPAWLAREKGLL